MSITPLRAMVPDRLPPLVAADNATEQSRAARLHEKEVRLNAFELELCRRERDLDRRERRLAERERAESARDGYVAAREAEIGRPTLTPGSVADRIVEMGRIRRGEIEEAPSATGLARQIIAAGAKARGEITDDKAPTTEAERMAAAIIAAGRKRRGEE